MGEIIKVLGKAISREEFEEDEKLVYLTLLDMLTLVNLIRELEKGPTDGDSSDLAEIRERLFGDVWGNPKVMRRLNKAKLKFLTEVREALDGKEEAE